MSDSAVLDAAPRRFGGARSARAESELFARRHVDPRAREELVARFMPLARSVARRYDRSSEPLDDLVQIASMALVKAVDRYDPSRGSAFSSYAVPTISGEIKRYFRDRSWSVRPPRDLQELTLRIEAAITNLSSRNDRAPTVAELAAALDLTDERVLEGLQARGARGALSLHGRAGDQDERALEERLGCSEEGYARAEERALLGDLLADLPLRTRYVLRRRFEDDLTQSEIAELIGVSQMQVSRIIRAALEHLRMIADGRLSVGELVD
jgi:RNA polymerase sigma-B factor